MGTDITAEFRNEYEAERNDWLGRRYVIYAAAMILLDLFGGGCSILVPIGVMHVLSADLIMAGSRAPMNRSATR